MKEVIYNTKNEAIGLVPHHTKVKAYILYSDIDDPNKALLFFPANLEYYDTGEGKWTFDKGCASLSFAYLNRKTDEWEKITINLDQYINLTEEVSKELFKLI